MSNETLIWIRKLPIVTSTRPIHKCPPPKIKTDKKNETTLKRKQTFFFFYR